MEEKIKYITESNVASINVSELDTDWYNELGIDIENESANTIFKGNRTADGFPINIDRLIDIFTKHKKNGATHVSIEHDSDHYGYVMDMIKFSESTTEEILEYDNNQPRLIRTIEDYSGIPAGSKFNATKCDGYYTGVWSSMAGTYTITIPTEVCEEV